MECTAGPAAVDFAWDAILGGDLCGEDGAVERVFSGAPVGDAEAWDRGGVR
jgi:hypothetical protein